MINGSFDLGAVRRRAGGLLAGMRRAATLSTSSGSFEMVVMGLAAFSVPGAMGVDSTAGVLR
jgi:hypothetical protein